MLPQCEKCKKWHESIKCPSMVEITKHELSYLMEAAGNLYDYMPREMADRLYELRGF